VPKDEARGVFGMAQEDGIYKTVEVIDVIVEFLNVRAYALTVPISLVVHAVHGESLLGEPLPHLGVPVDVLPVAVAYKHDTAKCSTIGYNGFPGSCIQ